jgi:hypothetical protein
MIIMSNANQFAGVFDSSRHSSALTADVEYAAWMIVGNNY